MSRAAGPACREATAARHFEGRTRGRRITFGFGNQESTELSDDLQAAVGKEQGGAVAIDGASSSVVEGIALDDETLRAALAGAGRLPSAFVAFVAGLAVGTSQGTGNVTAARAAAEAVAKAAAGEAAAVDRPVGIQPTPPSTAAGPGGGASPMKVSLDGLASCGFGLRAPEAVPQVPPPARFAPPVGALEPGLPWLARPPPGLNGVPIVPWQMVPRVGMLQVLPTGACAAPLLPPVPRAPAPKGGGEAKAVRVGQGKAKSKCVAKAAGPRAELAQPGTKSSPEPPPRREAEVLSEVQKCGLKCRLTVGALLPHLAALAQDASGSAFLVAKLDCIGAKDLAAVFEALTPEARKLACDGYGFSVLLRLLDVGSAPNRAGVVAQLRGAVVRLSCDRYGCRVIQRALEVVPQDMRVALARELPSYVCACIESMHGNHVIQKCVEKLPTEAVQFIIDEVEAHADRVASHIYGCRVIQRMFERCSEEQLQKTLEQVLVCIPELASDAYGNHVVRHVLENGKVHDQRRIIRAMQGDVLRFAKSRSSSLVVEKCLVVSTSGPHAAELEPDRASLVAAILGAPSDPNPPVRHIAADRFGNYIVQRLIKCCQPEEQEVLRQHLIAAEAQLRQSAAGKHILIALQQ